MTSSSVRLVVIVLQCTGGLHGSRGTFNESNVQSKGAQLQKLCEVVLVVKEHEPSSRRTVCKERMIGLEDRK